MAKFDIGNLKSKLKEAGDAAKSFVKENTGIEVDNMIQDASDALKAATKDVSIDGIRGTVQDAIDSTKEAVRKAKASQVKNSGEAQQEVSGEPVTAAEPADSPAEDSVLVIRAISTRNAIKIIYYLMAADGEIFHSEEEKFDELGKALDPDFAAHREQIIKDCQKQLDKVIDPHDYYDVLQDGVEDALIASRQTEDTFITPKLLVWDLLTVAYSDENYDETERKLIKYIVRKTDVDKTVFLEMESSILTLMDIEKELAWIKTTDRPYLVIEAMVNELADRKNVIFESVKDLISL